MLNPAALLTAGLENWVANRENMVVYRLVGLVRGSFSGCVKRPLGPGSLPQVVCLAMVSLWLTEGGESTAERASCEPER